MSVLSHLRGGSRGVQEVLKHWSEFPKINFCEKFMTTSSVRSSVPLSVSSVAKSLASTLAILCGQLTVSRSASHCVASWFDHLKYCSRSWICFYGITRGTCVEMAEHRWNSPVQNFQSGAEGVQTNQKSAFSTFLHWSVPVNISYTLPHTPTFQRWD